MDDRQAKWGSPVRILFGIPIAVVLIFAAQPVPVAFAWGGGSGGANIPGFGALWQEPTAPGLSQDMKNGSNGGSAHRRWSKGRKKGPHSATGSPTPRATPPRNDKPP
jgi:hypothetical protein